MQNRGGYSGQRSQPRAEAERPPSYIASADYLSSGYFDKEQHVRPDILTVEAQRVAEELQRAYPKLNYGQLRRFFAKIRFIQLQLQANPDSFGEARAQIASLIPAAADAINRGVAPAVFRTFIEKNVKLAQQNQRSFLQGFLLHFQSVICYYPRQSGQ